MNKDAEQETFQHSESAIEEEIRCRICFVQTRPLLALCQCAGSMAYVHEECILDWISTKMAQDDAPLVPFCEICRTPYSARLRAGSRKLSFERLRDKLCHLRLSEKWLAIYFLLGTIFSLYLVAKIFLQLLCLLGEWIWDYESNFSLQLKVKPIETLFTHIVLTSCFLHEAFASLAKLNRLVFQSFVQIIEFTIEPRIVLR